MRKAVFFDLDGTLLPLDMRKFMRAYFLRIKRNGFYRLLGRHARKAFTKAVYAMLKNDGRGLNRDVFFDTLFHQTGAEKEALLGLMDAFYQNEFLSLKAYTRTERLAVQTVRLLKQKGYRLVLATNPLFPPEATNTRIEWAGLETDDFEYVSYYDNSRYCKPNLKYFEEILGKTGLSADACYYVGNDVKEDMACLDLGFEGFLVLDHLIGDARRVPQCAKGYYSDLLGFAESLPQT